MSPKIIRFRYVYITLSIHKFIRFNLILTYFIIFSKKKPLKGSDTSSDKSRRSLHHTCILNIE